MTKAERAEIKAWMDDIIDDGRYQFHAVRGNSSLVRITEGTGKWSGNYCIEPGTSRFFLYGINFNFLETPLRVCTADFWRVVEHFEITGE